MDSRGDKYTVLGPKPTGQLATIITILSAVLFKPLRPLGAGNQPGLQPPWWLRDPETGRVLMTSVMQTSRSELHVILEAKLQILDNKQAEPTPSRKNS